jgi:hypothetical protein
MITLAQINAIPRPNWMTAYEEQEDGKELSYLTAKDGRIEDWKSISIGVMQQPSWKYRDLPRIEVYLDGRSIDERIEFYQHAKVVAALFDDPKVRFYS